VKEIIVIVAFIIMLVLYILINIERKKNKREEEEKETGKIEKLLSVIREYAKDQPKLAEIMNKLGLL
jgi:large-conductance mechanosensitive channel